MEINNLSYLTITTTSDELIKTCIVSNDKIDTFVEDCKCNYGEHIDIFCNKVSLSFNGELVMGKYNGKIY